MAHINNTLIRKRLVNEASDQVKPYRKYRDLITKARESGYPDSAIVTALECEKMRIQRDERDGDNLFQEGLNNSKVACLNAIALVIAELKGDK